MNIDRLEKLSYMLGNLETLFPDAYGFDIGNWIVKGKPKVIFKNGNECGTVACAFGYACLYEPFIREGLKLKLYLCGTPDFSIGDKLYKNYGFEAARDFFDIPIHTTYWLFGRNSYDWRRYEPITPKQVKCRVDALISGDFNIYDYQFGRYA